MRKILTLTLIFIASISNTVCKAQTTTSGYDWARVIDAIAQVESKGNPNARNGSCCGILQITPICVKQVNILVGRQAYTLKDRFDVKKSKEMFVIIQEHYNKQNDVERAIRSWKGGNGYTKKGTERYYREVMKIYNNMGDSE